MVNKKTVAVLALATLMILSFYAALPAKATGETFTVTDETNGRTDYGNGGDNLTFSGSGFVDDSSVAILLISLNGVPGGDSGIDIPTDGSGNFAATAFNVETTGGTYVLQAVGDDSGNLSPEITFIVKPFIVLDPNAGDVGGTVTVTGNGFAQDAVSDGLSATFNGITLILDNIDKDGNDGNFIATFTVPSTVPGIYPVVVQDATDPSISASAQFITPPGFILPEYPFAALTALLACFACFGTLAVFRKRRGSPA